MVRVAVDHRYTQARFDALIIDKIYEALSMCQTLYSLWIMLNYII